MNTQTQPDVSMPAGNSPDPINHIAELTVGREVAPAGYADAPTLVDDSELTTIKPSLALSAVCEPLPEGFLFTKKQAIQMMDYLENLKINNVLRYDPNDEWLVLVRKVVNKLTA